MFATIVKLSAEIATILRPSGDHGFETRKICLRPSGYHLRPSGYHAGNLLAAMTRPSVRPSCGLLPNCCLAFLRPCCGHPATKPAAILAAIAGPSRGLFFKSLRKSVGLLGASHCLLAAIARPLSQKRCKREKPHPGG